MFLVKNSHRTFSPSKRAIDRRNTVLQAMASEEFITADDSVNAAREPLQIGAELYGHGGIESDLEVQRLMLQALALMGIQGVHLDLGHVGVFRSLVKRASLAAELEADLFNALQRKDVPTLRTLVANLPQDVQAEAYDYPEEFAVSPTAFSKKAER